MPDTILGLDIGTTSTKAILFDLTGRELATARQDYPLATPHPGWAEQDPEQVWQALVSVLQQVAAQAGAEQRILALTLAAQSGSVIPADAHGNPVYPMITWLDRRTEELAQQWQVAGLEPRVQRLSGWLLHPGLPLLSIGWLRQHQPDIFARAARFMSVIDFLNHRLTGQFCTDHSSATEMLLLDVATGQWSAELCGLAGITPAHLSRLVPSGSVIGPLTAEASRLTGLPPDTRLVSGGHDQCATAMAMGMTDPGKLMLATGTAWVITGITASPDINAIPANMDLNFHVAPRRWTVSQLLGGFGASVEWWLTHNLQPPDSVIPRPALFAQVDTLLSESSPGSRGLLFLPPSGGAQLPHKAMWGGFIGLRLDHTRPDMIRAILEGAAFEVRWALAQMKQAGLPVEQLWVAGGATQSPVWPQILADVTGVPLLLTRYGNWPALGAAILAGWGAGVFDSPAAGIAQFQRQPQTVEPDPARARFYDEQFAVYRQTARHIAAVFD